MKGNTEHMAIRIYIDQGHNPSAPNTGPEWYGLREQDITYRVGQELYSLLQANPAFEARLSRPTPETQLGTSNATSLSTRTNQANSWPADLFLSIHTNASLDTSANGSEALVYRIPSTAASIARDILTSLTRATGLRNRGVIARPGLYVLRRTAMPAVLVEIGFLSNPAEAALMNENPRLFAEGIYEGLRAYYGV
jgi:N-acetylmuramoyl-L-alanine amidase